MTTGKRTDPECETFYRIIVPVFAAANVMIKERGAEYGIDFD